MLTNPHRSPLTTHLSPFTPTLALTPTLTPTLALTPPLTLALTPTPSLPPTPDQVEMGTASMRFGQACLSMTVRPDQGTVEKEQAGVKRV